MLHPTLGFIAVFVASMLMAACTQTVQYSQHFRIPVSSDPAIAGQQSACVAACDPLSYRDPSRYAECLLRCPYAEIVTEGTCDPNEPGRRAYCIEVVRERVVADPESTEAALNTIGAMLELLDAVSAVAADHCNTHPSHGSHHTHHRQHRSAPSRKPKISVLTAAMSE